MFLISARDFESLKDEIVSSHKYSLAKSVIPECALFSLKVGSEHVYRELCYKVSSLFDCCKELNGRRCKQNSWKTVVNIENTDKNVTKKLLQHLFIKEFAAQNVMKRFRLGPTQKSHLKTYALRQLITFGFYDLPRYYSLCKNFDVLMQGDELVQLLRPLLP